MRCALLPLALAAACASAQRAAPEAETPPPSAEMPPPGAHQGASDGPWSCDDHPWFWRCFPERITSTFPGGIDVLYLNRTCPGLLRGDGCAEEGLASIDRMFDVFGWELFVALNWPRSGDGTPQPRISTRGDPVWSSWQQAPSSERGPRTPTSCVDVDPHDPVLMGLADRMPPDDNRLVDRYGRAVSLETRLDPLSAEHFRRLDTLAKQAKEACRAVRSGVDVFRELVWGYIFTDKATRPESYAQLRHEPVSGPIHVKLAYRRLDARDDPSRFVTVEQGGARLGLVAMHVVAKVVGTDDRWVWATFEHADAVGGADPFFDGDRVGSGEASDRASNRCPVGQDADRPTLVARERPLAPEVEALNDDVRARLRALESPMQNYALIGVQWSYPAAPKDPSSRRAYRARPENLANAVIEWDRQRTDCMGCHANAVTYQPSRELCEEERTDDGRGAGARDRVVPTFASGDFFWAYKSVDPGDLAHGLGTATRRP